MDGIPQVATIGSRCWNRTSVDVYDRSRRSKLELELGHGVNLRAIEVSGIDRELVAGHVESERIRSDQRLIAKARATRVQRIGTVTVSGIDRVEPVLADRIRCLADGDEGRRFIAKRTCCWVDIDFQ